ncbi:hypothetical protein IPL68_01820 [Candidatus Saccharibacteria bacterium]|nr:MAG: hypothetical protein IPL68_01820 [Candidatus Saccharibacteria bacterium]
MKAFVATRVSGEGRVELREFLTKLKTSLETAGIEPYLTELAAPQPDDNKKLLRAFGHIAESDVLIVIYKPGPASEGMSAEVGYAYGRKPIWIFAQEGSESKLFATAEKLVFWRDEAELLHKIEGVT